MATVISGGRDRRGGIDELRAAFRGALIRPNDPDYEEARRVYNGGIDRRPALIARPVDTGDVSAAVLFGQRVDLPIAVRGGGHHGAGFGTIDDGLVIDLGGLKGIRVDADARTVRVEPAALSPTSTMPRIHSGSPCRPVSPGSTGIAGLTLGGGIGNLSRAYGLTIDNLIEADVVLASGELVTTDAERDPDLYWALRGGGGNFGIVTSFLFRLHPVSTIVGGPVFWDLDQAADVLRWYRDFIREAPPELNGWFAFVTIPPVPVFPEHLHGRKMAAVVWCWSGPLEGADAAFAPVKAFGPPGVVRRPGDALPCPPGDVRPPGIPLDCSGNGGPTSSRRSRTRRSSSMSGSVPSCRRVNRRCTCTRRPEQSKTSAETTPRSAIAMRTGRWSSPGSTRTRRTPRPCATGRRSTGRRSTHTRPAAPT